MVEYCQCVDDIPTAAPDLLTRLVDLLKVFTPPPPPLYTPTIHTPPSPYLHPHVIDGGVLSVCRRHSDCRSWSTDPTGWLTQGIYPPPPPPLYTPIIHTPPSPYLYLHVMDGWVLSVCRRHSDSCSWSADPTGQLTGLYTPPPLYTPLPLLYLHPPCYRW